MTAKLLDERDVARLHAPDNLCCPIAEHLLGADTLPVGDRYHVRVDGPGVARRLAATAGDLRDAHRNVHQGGHLGECADGVAALGRNRHHCFRNNAGGGISGALRMGL